MLEAYKYVYDFMIDFMTVYDYPFWSICNALF